MGLHQVDMPSHSFHQVVFFKSSSLYRRTGPIKVNCTTFHHFLQLSAADQDLHWALGLCFVCGKVKHRSECCSEVNIRKNALALRVSQSNPECPRVIRVSECPEHPGELSKIGSWHKNSESISELSQSISELVNSLGFTSNDINNNM